VLGGGDLLGEKKKESRDVDMRKGGERIIWSLDIGKGEKKDVELELEERPRGRPSVELVRKKNLL